MSDWINCAAVWIAAWAAGHLAIDLGADPFLSGWLAAGVAMWYRAKHGVSCP